MNVVSAKKKPLNATGIKDCPARVYTEATAGCSLPHGIRIKVEPSHDETQTIKEEVTSAEPCPSKAVSPSEVISPKLEPDCEGVSSWAVIIKTEPESDFEIPQPGEADLKPVKREDGGDQDVKLEAPEDGASLATDGQIKCGRPLSSPEAHATPPRKRPNSSVPPDVRKDGIDHFPTWGTRQRCKYCTGNHFSHVYCGKCKVHLCLNKDRNCFIAYHKAK